MNVRRWVAAGASTALLAAGSVIAAAAPASAASTDQIWYQSIGSASKEAPCPDSDPADLAAGWTAWAKSYEMWPNDGRGGWTCGRSILWAKGSPAPSSSGYPSAGCEQLESIPVYFDFDGGWQLPVGTQGFHDSACSIPVTGWFMTEPFVYSPAPWDPADLCNQVESGSTPVPYGVDPDIYYCA